MMNNNRPSFEGSLTEFQLVELAQALSISNGTGALHLQKNQNQAGIIYFKNGALTACREYGSGALTLGAVMQQQGILSKQYLDTFITTNIADDPIGDILGRQLIGDGKITQQQLNEALQTQMLWTVREMSQWNEGSYSFEVNEEPPMQTYINPIESTRVVMEIIRYQHEWDDLKTNLPNGMNTKLRLQPQVRFEGVFRFQPYQWVIIAHTNEYKTPRNIAAAIMSPEIDVARTLAFLVQEKFITNSFLLDDEADAPIMPLFPAKNIELFNEIAGLTSKMEQEITKMKNGQQAMVTLATFVNWTMDMLKEIVAKNNRTLNQNSLRNMLIRSNAQKIGPIALQIQNNSINLVEFNQNLTDFIRATNSDNINSVFKHMFQQFQKVLTNIFAALSARMGTLDDIKTSESILTTIFQQFAQSLDRLLKSAQKKN